MNIVFPGYQTWIFAVRLFIYYMLNVQCQGVVSDNCTVNIDDKYWPYEWYLNKSTPGVYDMNVMPAWRSCVNGTGITIGIVDNGIQNHYDLNINRSLDFGGVVTVSTAALKHGTRVAGIIGARKNSNGPIGIAFGSELADIQIASSAVFNTFNTAAFTFKTNIIDVYSCSFANFHTGTRTYPLMQDQEEAFKRGTSLGRRGLGSIYVFATGNSGGEVTDIRRDSCAYDRLVTNRYVIAVAGIQHDLQKLPHGEACSAMMVAAFTAVPGIGPYKLITTDIGNTYTYNFNQNSAAVPMVSGAIALALNANPHLTYRDIMHLIVETSSSHLLDAKYLSYFIRNAAALSVSSYFGFGLLNIGKLVEQSKTWKNVPPRIDCTNVVTFNTGLRGHADNFVVPIKLCRATYVEHIEVLLKVNNQQAGQIQWHLISPYGTLSTILPGRLLDSTNNMDLTVLTVQMWGENPIGYWRLEPTPVFGATLENGTVVSIGVTIHGFECTTNHKCLPPAPQVQGRWSGWSEWSSCSVTCGTGTRSRYRECNGHSLAKYCYGNSFLRQTCLLRPCLTNTHGAQNVNCPSASNLISSCVEQCSSDIDCSGQAMCCYNGCGHTCERTGAQHVNCPSASNLISSCVEQCSSDVDCFGQTKCCYNGCGHTCENTASITGKECMETAAGLSYRGTANITENGLTCQSWAQQTPHNHSIQPQHGNQLNYCRNPDGSQKPWCYTTDKNTRWQYCDIEICGIDCKESVAGSMYRGPINKTITNLTCQAWSLNDPHSHRYTLQLADQHNYCRNPDGSQNPWCYTTRKDITWQYCDVPLCGKKKPTCKSFNTLVTDCSVQCQTDRNCVAPMKCCYNGCSHSCSYPDY